jgi:flagellar protein FliS
MSYSNYARAANAYREREVMTATPARLVVIVYDHVLANLFRARATTGTDKLELRLEALTKARAGIMELLTTLDVEKGGDMAKNLRGIYGFVFTQLMDEARRPDLKRLDRITNVVGELREAFATIAGETARVSAA